MAAYSVSTMRRGHVVAAYADISTGKVSFLRVVASIFERSSHENSTSLILPFDSFFEPRLNEFIYPKLFRVEMKIEESIFR